jgi:demethylmenaquinone methyltransferase/2-methoxy-6-polyprenyl-1,4-benzoquinol methylase
MDRDRHLGDPAAKQRYVTGVFDSVAGSYDRFTRAFSFGMDAGWKRELLALLAERLPRSARVLDVASGTGDLAIGAALAAPDARVMALDPSERMMAVAAKRVVLRAPPHPGGGPRTELVRGDLMHLPRRSASADVVLAGYAFRNVPDVTHALAEVRRVLRPGGWLLSLDFYRPANRIWRALYLAYLRWAGSAAGWMLHRSPETYGYIAPSLAGFMSADEFSAQLAGARFIVEEQRSKLGGGIAVHVARRDGGTAA